MRTPLFRADGGGGVREQGGNYVARWFWVPIALNGRRLWEVNADAGRPVEARELSVMLARLLSGWATRAKSNLDSGETRDSEVEPIVHFRVQYGSLPLLTRRYAARIVEILCQKFRSARSVRATGSKATTIVECVVSI